MTPQFSLVSHLTCRTDQKHFFTNLLSQLSLPLSTSLSTNLSVPSQNFTPLPYQNKQSGLKTRDMGVKHILSSKAMLINFTSNAYLTFAIINLTMSCRLNANIPLSSIPAIPNQDELVIRKRTNHTHLLELRQQGIHNKVQNVCSLPTSINHISSVGTHTHVCQRKSSARMLILGINTVAQVGRLHETYYSRTLYMLEVDSMVPLKHAIICTSFPPFPTYAHSIH